MNVSIIVVNYNTRDSLKRCLRSIDAFVPARDFEVIVVDNASNDGSSLMLKRLFPRIRLVENTTNEGFSRAVNRGIANSSGDLFLFLNPDVILTPGCVDALAEFLDKHPDAGICGPKLLNPDGSVQLSCRSFPTPFNVFFGRKSIWNKLFPQNRISRGFLLADLDYDEIQEVDWLAGACMMAKKNVVDSVGLFDERYFLFVEDTDFCYRVRKIGFKVYFVPQAVATHERGASMRYFFVLSTYNHNLSMYRYFLKHYRLNWAVRWLVAMGLILRMLLVITVEGIARSF
jgi:GT2 family glycosyltransferase